MNAPADPPRPRVRLAPATPPPTTSGLASTAIISLVLRKPGATRRAPGGTVDVVGTSGGDPDADSATVSVELLRAVEYKAITAHDAATRATLRGFALPAGKRIAPGSYLLPLAAVERVYAKLDAARAERADLVRVFADAYPRIVDDARARLRDAFDPRMFPAADAIRGAFSMDYELEVADREAGVRAASRSLSPAFVERELAKARESGAEMLAEIRDGLRVAFAGIVDAATDALAPGEDGKARKFSTGHVEKIQSFLATFGDRNISGDGDLAAVVTRAREVLAGVTPETVKDAKDRPARDRLSETLKGVRADLEAASIVAPRRRIELAPDDAPGDA